MPLFVRSDDDSARVTFPPPFIYLGLLLLGLLADWLLGLELPLDWPVRIAGLVLLGGAGLAVGLPANERFRRVGTDVRPWKSSSAFVADGVYRFTRNPMYLGMALIYAGLAMTFASVAGLALLPVLLLIVQTQVIAREERYLEGKFGEDYRRYKASVRRWL